MISRDAPRIGVCPCRAASYARMAKDIEERRPYFKIRGRGAASKLAARYPVGRRREIDGLGERREASPAALRIRNGRDGSRTGGGVSVIGLRRIVDDYLAARARMDGGRPGIQQQWLSAIQYETGNAGCHGSQHLLTGGPGSSAVRGARATSISAAPNSRGAGRAGLIPAGPRIAG